MRRANEGNVKNFPDNLRDINLGRQYFPELPSLCELSDEELEAQKKFFLGKDPGVSSLNSGEGFSMNSVNESMMSHFLRQNAELLGVVGREPLEHTISLAISMEFLSSENFNKNLGDVLQSKLDDSLGVNIYKISSNNNELLQLEYEVSNLFRAILNNIQPADRKSCSIIWEHFQFHILSDLEAGNVESIAKQIQRKCEEVYPAIFTPSSPLYPLREHTSTQLLHIIDDLFAWNDDNNMEDYDEMRRVELQLFSNKDKIFGNTGKDKLNKMFTALIDKTVTIVGKIQGLPEIQESEEGDEIVDLQFPAPGKGFTIIDGGKN